MSVCYHDSCDKYAEKRRMCQKHYRQWWRNNNRQRAKLYNKQYYQDVEKPNNRKRGILALNQQQRDCVNCNKTFVPTGHNQKYCSKHVKILLPTVKNDKTQNLKSFLIVELD